MKTCKACGQLKALSEFHRDRRNRDGHVADCKECACGRTRQWSKDNPKRKAENARNWKNSDSGKESMKREYQKHRASYLERAKNWVIRNREKHYESTSGWRKRNPEQTQTYRENWRSRKEAAGEYSIAEWIALCEKYGNKCLCCKQRKRLTVDHVIPLSKGGTNTIDNLQPLCRNCNSRKNTRIIDYRL